ncbi:cytochrome C oxidase subunit IV family protein [Tundrisphaera lichenicola]|uniref:cytochrome C oxidase subunit IV family protein n=1 Tax=Tundrisphaera lichenicola TaxID=2029860 RepID=UPI003EBB2E23
MSTHTGSAHHTHRPLYIKVFVALMVLLVLTVVAAKMNLGELNLIAALGIAVVKAALIVLFFMHFRESEKLTWLIGAATLVWFGILVVLTYNDYWSRDWLHMPGK